MAQDKTTPTPPASQPVAELLPQVGGSYTRQPDGSLLRTDDAPAPAAPAAPAQPTTDTPE